MKMVRGRASVGLSLVLGLAASACGGSSSSSGVDTSKDLGAATATELTDICRTEVNARYDSIDEQQYCKAVALSGLDDDDEQAELRADCQTIYDSCLTDAAATLKSNRESQLSGCSRGIREPELFCSGVTVGELETCYSDRLDQLLDRIAEAPDCGNLTSRDQVEYEDGDVASCELIEDRCDDDDD